MNDPISVSMVCMLAGKITLESGAETHRVEDTMNRIASAFGLEDAQSYATPTGINFSSGPAESTNFIRISNRSTDLHKIANVNDISRKITAGEVDLPGALKLLKEVDRAKLTFPGWMQIISAAFVSGSFAFMFGGTWLNYLPAFFIGGLGFAALIGCDRFINTRFISEFLASILIGLLAFISIYCGWGSDLNKIIIGAVMPLVPGLHITNAVRDLMAGHLIAGLSKGVEAFLTAFAIGAGVAVVIGII
ncbi:threonine/serine exporter family protein [Lentibacillus sp. L22]|uniref:threonine/serine exporter family protein n=1 Tax=Lentibacillus TaxID=175304 RepID=UPI0022B1C6A1|nr:threonine/serine exporter family protein [Lentibacillus daqui]